MGKIFVKQTTALFALLILFLTMVCVGLLVALLKAKDNHEQATAAKARLASTRHRGTLGAAPVRIIPAPSVVPSKQLIVPSTTVTSVNLSSILITSTKPPPTTEEPEPQFRLPSHVYPEHYYLTLQPDLKQNRFSGHVQIRVNLSLPTNEFVVHRYKNLKIRKTAVRRVSDGGEVEIDEPIYYPDKEFYIVPTIDTVSHEDKYYLEFDFDGIFNGSIVGFYKSTYVDSRTNETRYLATSKFQPTYARRAFPCFDEPGFKSQFTVTLVHEEGYKALSNMPEQVPQKRPDGLLETKFQTSVPMVTYLVCFIVSDFENTNGVTSHGIPFRVFSTPDQVNKTRYALNLGMKVLDYFTDYFNVSYPLPKQDMIAIPDFVSGAMEHWGLITFRETNLLYDQSDSSTQNKQRVAVVIAHELAHMWFGNLVTMGWWDDLWLNEGFASYVEYKGVNQVEPEWDVLGQFVIEDLQSVMELDSTTSSHPIIQEVNHPDEITEIFDSISYSKGAAVLRMLEFFLGEENFQRGVSNFLKKYAYSNANTSNLWVELQEVAPKTIQDLHLANIMDTWTKQMGLPVISIFRDPANPGHVIAKQERFLSNPEMAKEKQEESPYRYKWIVPLSYITSDGKKGIEWITGDQHEFVIEGLDSEAWIKFNENQTGYYIVNYETYDWISLSSVLNTDRKSLSATDRSNVLYDAFQLSKAGYLGYNILLNMTLYLKQERHLIPWETAYEGLVHMSKLLEFTEVNLLMRKYIYNITLPTYEDLGWDDQNNHLKNLLRTTIIGLACHSGNQHCLKEASSRLEAWMKTNKEIPTNLRSLVYHYGMAEIGREKHWNYMWQRYLNENSAQERRKLLYGLAHVREPWLISRYLEYAMDVNKVRRQDFFTVLAYVAGNPVGRPIVWNFVRDKWPWLVATFSLNDRYLGKAIKSICEKFTTQIQLDEMESFFRKYPEAGAGSMARQQALEIVRNNINWLKKYKRVVHKWLLSRERAPNPWLNARLPTNIVPEHYDLTLHPNLTTGVLTGKVNISVNLWEPTNCFLIHIHNLKVTKTVVRRASDGYPINILSAFHYKKNEFWVLETIKRLPANEKYNIYMEFKGSVNNGLVGLYKSTYKTSLNETRYLITTQFEPTYARQAFPCFDEPYFKATFTMTVIHDDGFTAISNMDEQEIVPLENNESLLQTKFRKTVPMSTYLVALTISDFTNINNKDTRIMHRVSARAEEIGRAKYALNTGLDILPFFEEYFNISYPLPKLDQIAIPDFKAGAMENWGLVTYREVYLLYDEQTTSTFEQQKICSTISHELAHMWFGNLVTMKWWDDLWLNEGFASFIQYKGVNKVHPSWDWLDQFVVNDFLHILEPDATLASHPIIVPVSHPDEISEIFDYITYSKGATVLRMLDFFLGEENFQAGLQEYLNKYKFNNTLTIDLWNELQKFAADGVDVARVMDTWTRQKGYPYITIERDVIDPKQFTATQRRFLLSQEDRNQEVNDSSYGYMWEVPLSYYTSEDSTPQIVWIRDKEPVTFTVDVENPSSSWIKFNVRQTGYYIVKYPEEEWPKISQVLLSNHEKLSPSDRANLIVDSLFLARGHLVPYESALDVTQYLVNERHFVPWSAAASTLGYIRTLFQEDKEAKKLFEDYLISLARPVLNYLGWENQGSHLDKLLRATIIGLCCASGDQQCLEEAAARMHLWKETGRSLPPDLRPLIYQYGMWANGTEEDWDYMWQQYKTVQTAQEKAHLMGGLTHINDVQILERFIELAKDDKNVRSQDFLVVIVSIGRNPVGRKLVWRFIREEWEFLVERYTLNEAHLGLLIKSISKYFTTKEQLEELEEFYEMYPDAGAAARARIEAKSIIKNNMEWLRNFKEPVVAWLRSRGSSVSAISNTSNESLIMEDSTASFSGTETIFI